MDGTPTEAERRAMRRALDLAVTPGVPLGPNPRVGCVLLDPAGVTLAEGHHRGAGTPHAEAAALATAGPAARGATAVVTLEPCAHRGRTGPCTEALLDAGVRRVVFARPDPNAIAAGGADRLRAAGVDVVGGLEQEAADAANRYWLFGLRTGRPYVTWKVAASLDGRTAATDGSSRWISSPSARRDVHALRAACDVVLVGTGTALADDPALTVRDAAGVPLPATLQPLRAVLGNRALPAGAALLDDRAETVRLTTREPAVALAELFDRGRRHVLLEGGATVAAAFLRAGLVDEVRAYLAPVLIGDGPGLLTGLGVGTLADAPRLELVETTCLGVGPERNLRVVLRPPGRTEPVTLSERGA